MLLKVYQHGCLCIPQVQVRLHQVIMTNKLCECVFLPEVDLQRVFIKGVTHGLPELSL